MDRKCKLVAGCFSSNIDINKASGKKYGITSTRVYTNWQTLVEKEAKRIDAVVILTPTGTHFEIVLRCIEIGLPVICEKALTSSSKHALAISEELKRKKGFLAVTYNYSGYPMVREFRAMIEDGVLGKVLYFHAEIPQETYLRLDEKGNCLPIQSWRLEDGKIPIIYLDLCVHLHHLIHYLVGETPLRVTTDQRKLSTLNVVDHVTSLCNYKSDVTGTMTFGKALIGYGNGLRVKIYGDLASAEWSQEDPEKIQFCSNADHIKIIKKGPYTKIANLRRYNRFKHGHPSGFIEAFANLYTDIAEQLLNHDNPSFKNTDVFGVEHAIEGLKLIEGMVASSSKEAWVNIN